MTDFVTESSTATSSHDLIIALHNFCAQATSQRDPSHGWQHMDCVRNNSLRIWEVEKYQYVDKEGYDVEYMTRLIIAASQLHDVADHKYGKTEDQLSSVRLELSKHFSATDVALIESIIENMSYSKEAKHRQVHGSAPAWDELGQVGKIVRNICSDADKVEAIGVIGIERCMQYTAMKMSESNKPSLITPSVLIDRLIEHGHEKLFILLDEYIYTSGGKALAKPHHDLMMQEVERLQAYLATVQPEVPLVEQLEKLKHFDVGNIVLNICLQHK